MNAIIRVMTAVNRVKPGHPDACRQSIDGVVSAAEASAADILIFPSLSLSSPSCGNLFMSSAVLDAALEGLDHLRVATSHLPSYIIVGLPIRDVAGPASVMAVLYRGELVGYLPTLDGPDELARTALSDNILPMDTVFACGDLRFVILSCDPLALPRCLGDVAHTGFDLAIVPSYQPATAGYFDRVCETVEVASRSYGCAVACVNGGLGDTSFPYVYRGFAAIYECGQRLAAEQVDDSELTLGCDIDADVIAANKAVHNVKPPFHAALPQTRKHGLMRPLSREPFLPADPDARKRYLDELFALQVRSLTARLANTGLKKMVVGVSGGLDSTLALLVAAAAADGLGLPRRNVVAVTMPGLGTSDRTYYNALALIEHLGCDGRDISIKNAVLQHFADIGHDPAVHDITYENAQARERTQVLLDIGNGVGGIVVGTGDLSEEALGWCTFGGDQLASYNVNVCLTKGMVRAVVRHLCDGDRVPGGEAILLDILDTPVSPELVPAETSGSIAQKTEDILGPYELHDFFLYNLVRYGFRPSKLYYYACIAFSGAYEPRYIKEKLMLFLKKFCAGQFKRSCAPDGASITEVNLLGVNFYIPSDLSADILLRDVENIDF